ncbi:MAG: DedA family protein [Actinobacteria bacterium]|nr:MAG: DedA family protein [Actinomycetota bacterium]
MLALLTDTIIRLVSEHGYLAIFVLMLLDSACVPFPSEVTLLFGGALTSTLVVGAGQELSLVGVVFWAIAGTLIGSWLAYGVGFAGGRPAIDRFGRYLLIRPHEIDRAHDWFERHGEAVAAYGRLIPLVRSFVSLPAGVAAMRFWRFTLYTLAGSVIWCVGLASIGHVFGDRWREIERVIQPFAWIIAGVVVVAFVVFVSRRWEQVRREYAALDGREDGPASR